MQFCWKSVNFLSSGDYQGLPQLVLLQSMVFVYYYLGKGFSVVVQFSLDIQEFVLLRVDLVINKSGAIHAVQYIFWRSFPPYIYAIILTSFNQNRHNSSFYLGGRGVIDISKNVCQYKSIY